MTYGTVAVIGAGPAGCAAANCLANRGRQVVILERGHRQKDKPCGDAYLPDAVDHLATLGITLDAFPACGARSFQRIDLWDANRPIWSISLENRNGWIAPRAAIDQTLRDVAATSSELRYESTVIAVDSNPCGWQLTIRSRSGVESQETFAAVVLATGAANAFSRRLGVSGKPITGASISVYATLAGVDAPLFQFAPLGVPGYGWVFPLSGDRVNIGVCTVAAAPANLRSTTEKYLERWRPSNAGSFRAGAGPMWSNQGTRWHLSGGLVSCGDAAGLVDPLTGEGIAPAMESGIAAANAIDAYLASRDDHQLAAYSRWVLSTYQSRYAATPVRRMWQYLNFASQTSLTHAMN